MSAPVIQTERLTLRAHRLDDYAACRAMWADPNVVRYIGGTPSSAQQTWMRMLNYTGHWSLMGFGYWLIEETQSGLFVGEAGFADFKRGLHPSMEGVPEIGWALASEMHGRGFATEAVRAVVAWSDRTRDWPRTVCMVNEDNAASLRVAQKCGYAQYDRIEHNGSRLVLFERLR